MLVRFSTNYNLSYIARQCPQKSLEWGDFKFTLDDTEKCDFLVSLNPPNRDLHGQCGATNKLLVIHEPPIHQYKWHKDSFNHYDRVFSQWPCSDQQNRVYTHGALPWKVKKTYQQLISLQPAGDKLNSISTITSSAFAFPGHKARWKLLKATTKSDLPIQYFGKGVKFIQDKFDGLAPFKYSIAIENSFHPHYWTEKIADCFLSWTMPIYGGCPNITDYFPEESMIIVDPNDPQRSIEKIKQAIANRSWEKNLDAINEARNLVLEKYQLFPWICEQIKRNQTSNREDFFIPKNDKPQKRGFGKLSSRISRKYASIQFKRVSKSLI